MLIAPDIARPELRNWQSQNLPALKQRSDDCLRMFGMNGGFSLRSHKICENAAREWRRKPLEKGCRAQTEDVFYTVTACRNPLYRLKHRFPGSNLARRFSVIDFDGALDVHSIGFVPFGVHGASTVLQYMDYLEGHA